MPANYIKSALAAAAVLAAGTMATSGAPRRQGSDRKHYVVIQCGSERGRHRRGPAALYRGRNIHAAVQPIGDRKGGRPQGI